jgi:hypothetical protein
MKWMEYERDIFLILYIAGVILQPLLKTCILRKPLHNIHKIDPTLCSKEKDIKILLPLPISFTIAVFKQKKHQ